MNGVSGVLALVCVVVACIRGARVRAECFMRGRERVLAVRHNKLCLLRNHKNVNIIIAGVCEQDPHQKIYTDKRSVGNSSGLSKPMRDCERDLILHTNHKTTRTL